MVCEALVEEVSETEQGLNIKGQEVKVQFDVSCV